MLDEQAVQSSTQWIYSLCEELAKLADETKSAKIRRIPHQSNWVSELGHPCLLYLTFQRTQWEQAVLHDVDRQYLYDEGNNQEDIIFKDLENMGVKVLERGVPIGHDAILRDLKIGGRLDGAINCASISHRLSPLAPQIDWARQRVVVECKAINPAHWEKLVDYDAIMTFPRAYVRRWAYQLQMYLFGHNDEAGMFVFKNKISGRLRFVPVTLDLDTCEMLAQKAKKVNEATEAYGQTKALPDPIPWHHDVCPTCPYLHICPNSREIKPTEITLDEELIGLMERREALAVHSRELDAINEEIDGKLERFNGQDVLISDRWQVRWKLIAESTRTVSQHYRKQIVKLPSGNEQSKPR